MVPGLANGPPFPSKAKKGAIVAVASLDNPSVPVVVGLCNIDVNLLGRVQGEKGNAVETLSWVGDEIWSWNPAGKSGIDPPESIEAWLQVDDVDVEETTQVLEGVSIENSKVATQTPKRSGNGASFDIDGDQETSNQKQWSTPGTYQKQTFF
jgi:translation initiation factor 2D